MVRSGIFVQPVQKMHKKGATRRLPLQRNAKSVLFISKHIVKNNNTLALF